MVKILSYVSKVNKNKNKLFNELMKNIKIKYEEDKINYEEYYFNGIPKPINSKFKDINTSSLNISWNIDNINNKEEIKHRIEMRKENEELKKIYEGNNNNYSINYLIKDIKTPFDIIDSNILKESKREGEYLNKLNEWIGYKKMELIYRGTRDGMTSDVFHNKCVNKGETITLIKNEKGNIFGGYASISWTTDKNKYFSAPESFLFTLSNIYNTEPTKFPSKNDKYEVKHNIDFGPAFGNGHDLGVYADILKDGGWTSFPDTYKDILGKGKSIFTGNSNNCDRCIIQIKEIEVFKIIK